MKPKRSNVFKCLVCDLRPEFGPLEMLDHMELVHGVPRGTPATKQMLYHSDDRQPNHHTTVWEWITMGTSGEVKFTQTMKQ